METERPRIPCAAALGAIGVPAKRWVTRADLFGQLANGRSVLGRGDGSTVADAAKAAGMSPERFQRLFRETEGVDPSAFAREARLQRARDLLVERTLSVGEVGIECGYQSASGFSRAFRAQFGRSPSDERRKMSDPAHRRRQS